MTMLTRLTQIILLLVMTAPAFAINQMMQDVDYVPSRNGQLMAEINFSVPVRYVSHFPIQATKQVEIHLLIRNLTPAELLTIPLEETRFAPKKSFFPIEEIMFDGYNKDDPLLIIKFRRPVTFRVGQTQRNTLQITFPSIALAPSASPALAARLKKQDAAELKKRRELERRKQQRENQRIAQRAKKRKKLQKQAKRRIPINKRTEARVAKLMRGGRDALTRKKNRQAINIFTSVLGLKNHSFAAEAQELLGVARERNGQVAHAKKVYKDYLALYPEGEGHNRVQQRLTDLVSNAMLPKGELKKAKSIGQKGFKKDVFGSFSVFSFAGQNDIGGVTSQQQTLQTYLNLSGRFRSPRFDIRSFVYGTASGSYANNEAEYEVEANSLYFDLKDSKLNYTMRFGRQSGNTGGIFGRFDGLKLGYELHKKFQLTGAAGYTVDYNAKDKIQTNMPFYSASMNIGSFFKYLDFSPYLFFQSIDGVTNRSAYGMETRFAHPRLNMFNVVDYDEYYQEYNIIMFYALFQATKKTKFNLNLDHRKNPLFQTTTALYSNTFRTVCDPNYQAGDPITPYNSVADIVNDCGEGGYFNEVKALTGNSINYTLGMNHTFTQNFQINMDVSRTLSEVYFKILEDIDPANPNTFFESVREQENFDQVSFSIQFIVNNLLKKRDTTNLGVRLIADEDFNGVNASLSNRISFNRNLRMNTRFLVDVRDYFQQVDENNAITEESRIMTRYRPSVKFDYRMKRKMELQAEFGLENTLYSYPVDANINNQTAQDSSGLFFTLGYRWDF